jgi:3-isopropylmalate/(R)-2-methylmalate dehydratase small subunit
MKIRGRVWKYGDEIDTDIIYPGKYLVSFDPLEAARHAMEGIEVDFHKKISKGDVLVVGKNFGSGSAREQAALALKYAGVEAVIGEIFPRTFYRNAINVGLPIVEIKGIKDQIDEKDEIEVDLDQGLIRNLTKGKNHHFTPLPPFILEILKMGGAVPYYKNRIGKSKMK